MPDRRDLLDLEAGGATETLFRPGVFSEIGALRDVLVHSPGCEVDTMTPSMMGELLFDDIIYGPRARREHRQFCAILERLGARVRDMERLLEESLAVAAGEIPDLIAEIERREGLRRETTRRLLAMSPTELAGALVHGIPRPPEEMIPDDLFQLLPLPNLLFSRDAQVVLGHDLIIGSMNHRARRREPLLSRFVFTHHPDLRVDRVLLDFSARNTRGAPSHAAPSFEGGDLLVFHEGVVLVGVSERTMETAVDALAEKLRGSDFFHSLIMMPMPRHRKVMHLDTIFTRIAHDQCLVYSPMVLPGNHESLSAIRIDLRRRTDWGRRHPGLLDALARSGVDLEPICCGSARDYIRQSREQWTDGANSFAIAPGVILIYSRNAATADELAARGYEVVAAAEMPFTDDWQCLHDFSPGKKYAILVCGEELSRARGGPRCMTLPLLRETPA